MVWNLLLINTLVIHSRILTITQEILDNGKLGIISSYIESIHPPKAKIDKYVNGTIVRASHFKLKLMTKEMLMQ